MSRSRPAALAYPETRYAAPALPDLSRLDERRRLTPAALKAFFNIVRHWSLRDEEARELLGDVSNGAYYLLKRNGPPPKALDKDRLTRISFLIGIFKSLNILYSQPLADQWMKLPNSNPIFHGNSALEFILQGGMPAMDVVRRLLDARRGGR